VEESNYVLPGQRSAADAIIIRQAQSLIAELARRLAESLAIYEPLPEQQRFHASMAPERLLRGSNRGGKTLPAAVEVARALTGQDPFNKYPVKDGRWICVGQRDKEVAEVLYRKLFRAGAFKMILDEDTGLWRAYRPWQDHARVKQAKPAPPLIPQRFIKEISWSDKKASVPSKITLVTGWELYFFSSKGKPPQGWDVDGAWFDEEITDGDWYPEVAARLVDRENSKFIWSACPQAATEHLYSLHERAELELHKEKPAVQEFYITLDDNPHQTAEQKNLFLSKLMSEEERRVRYRGEYLKTGYTVYPEYDDYVHGVPYFTVPANWCRFMVVDPGRQVCAALFAALPPPDDGGDRVYLYDELYIERCSAAMFGQKAGEKCRGQAFHTFLIDSHAGRITEMGSGKNIQRQYAEALKDNRVSCTRTGSDFMWGSDDLEGGIEAARNWLRIGGAGYPKLAVMYDRMANFRIEVKRYHYMRTAKGILSDQPAKGFSHLMDCLRYLAMYNPRYVRPPAVKKPKSEAVKAMEAKRKKAGQSSVRLGPRQQR
jgi:hypothetical protein